MTPSRDELLSAYAIPDRSQPTLRLNFVTSADGAATVGGVSGGLGGETDRAAMEVLRAIADVVVVGAGTVRAEGYGGTRVGDDLARWRAERGLRPQPRLATVSRDLDLDPRHPFFSEAVTRPIVVTCAHAPAERRAALGDVADVWECGGDDVDLDDMCTRFAREGLPQTLCEGGPHLFGSLLDAGLVDELCLTLSPTLVGGAAGRILRGASERERRMRLIHALPDDEGFVLLRYAFAG